MVDDGDGGLLVACVVEKVGEEAQRQFLQRDEVPPVLRLLCVPFMAADLGGEGCSFGRKLERGGGGGAGEGER